MLRNLMHQSEESQRWSTMGHLPAVILLSGPRASGKRTLGRALERKLLSMGLHTMHLDEGVLNRILGITGRMLQPVPVDFISRLTALMVEAGLVVVVSVDTNDRTSRERIRAGVSEGLFHVVYVDRPLDMCIERNMGDVEDIDAYQPPLKPDLRLDMAAMNEPDCVLQMVKLLTDQGCLDRRVRVRRAPNEKRPEGAFLQPDTGEAVSVERQGLASDQSTTG